MAVKHFNGFSVVDANMKINVDLKRFENQFANAQFYLDNQVMNDMIPFMPIQTGTFINNTRARSATYAGTGKVIAGAPPMGRYLYMGKVMVDSQTGKGAFPIKDVDGNITGFRFRKGASLVATERQLTYGNPNATPQWFETAKKTNGHQWIKGVKERAGGK